MTKSQQESTSLIKKMVTPFTWFWKRSLYLKIGVLALLGISGWLVVPRLMPKQAQQAQIQTASAQKGTIIATISSSGQISTSNAASISTQASGVVKNVFVVDGQVVNSGDKIAEVELDMEGKQRNASAWASYQGAKNNLTSAQINLYNLQSTLLTNWKEYMDVAQSSQYQNSDKSPRSDQRALPEFMVTNNDWLTAEATYKNQQNVISQAQTSVNSSWLSYQQSSPFIYAPISGKVTGLSLQIGSVLTTQTTTSGTSTAQKIASIKTDALPSLIVNLTEIDVPMVKIGNKATITFDALKDKSFSGKIVSVDTIGTVSSGVTNYQAVIKLDADSPEILSNMTGQANIITAVKNDVLIIPSTAIQTLNGQTVVRVLKNGSVEQIPVEIGLSSSSQSEIVSGLNEGDTVVTSQTTQQTRTTSQTQSPFSALGGAGFRTGSAGGGGAVLFRR